MDFIFPDVFICDAFVIVHVRINLFVLGQDVLRIRMTKLTASIGDEKGKQ